MPKRYLCGTDLIDVLEGRNLSIEARYLFRCLLANTYMSVDGLYHMTARNLLHISGIPDGAMGRTIDELVVCGLMVYDNELLFIPRIPDEQSLCGKTAWWSILRRSRTMYEGRSSSVPGAANKAYTAFLAHHASLFETIDAPGFDESIGKAKQRKAAEPLGSGGLSDMSSHSTEPLTSSYDETKESNGGVLDGVGASGYLKQPVAPDKQLQAPYKDKSKNSSLPSSIGKSFSGMGMEGWGESTREGKDDRPPARVQKPPPSVSITSTLSADDGPASVGDILRSMLTTGRPLHPS